MQSEMQHKHLLIAENHQSCILNFLKKSVCTNILYFRSSVGTLRHEPSDAHLLPAAILPHVLQHVRHSLQRRVAHDTRVSRRVLQRGGLAARRADRKVQRDTRHANNVHWHASSPAARGVWPVDVARWRLRRGADATRCRAASRREAPSSTDSGRAVLFVWGCHYLRVWVRLPFQSNQFNQLKLSLHSMSNLTLISTKDIESVWRTIILVLNV